MHKYAIILSVVAILLLPLGLRACDCGEDPQGLVHFKDGLTPNGPVDVTARPGGDECYSADFIFHDYGPARVTPPPVEPPKPSS